MRLRAVTVGQPLAVKIIRVVKMLTGYRAGDMAKVLLYRPELFGRFFQEAKWAALRAPSAWSPDERQLFATFVSRENRCAY